VEGAAHQELINFFTELGGGECPNLSEDLELAARLMKAFHDEDDTAPEDPPDESVH
jgi:hypothetical protein